MAGGMIWVAEIKEAVARDYGVTVADLDSPSVLRVHSRPRHAAMLLAYLLTDHSKARISSFFHKSPNLAGAVIARDQRAADPNMRKAMKRITLELAGR